MITKCIMLHGEPLNKRELEQLEFVEPNLRIYDPSQREAFFEDASKWMLPVINVRLQKGFPVRRYVVEGSFWVGESAHDLSFTGVPQSDLLISIGEMNLLIDKEMKKAGVLKDGEDKTEGDDEGVDARLADFDAHLGGASAFIADFLREKGITYDFCDTYTLRRTRPTKEVAYIAVHKLPETGRKLFGFDYTIAYLLPNANITQVKSGCAGFKTVEEASTYICELIVKAKEGDLLTVPSETPIKSDIDAITGTFAWNLYVWLMCSRIGKYLPFLW